MSRVRKVRQPGPATWHTRRSVGVLLSDNEFFSGTRVRIRPKSTPLIGCITPKRRPLHVLGLSAAGGDRKIPDRGALKRFKTRSASSFLHHHHSVSFLLHPLWFSVKMGDVKKSKTPKEFAGMYISFTATVAARESALPRPILCASSTC